MKDWKDRIKLRHQAFNSQLYIDEGKVDNLTMLGDFIQSLLTQQTEELEIKLDKLYTDTEKSTPPMTLSNSDSDYNEGFYRGQLKALESVCVRVFEKTGDKLPDSPTPKQEEKEL